MTLARSSTPFLAVTLTFLLLTSCSLTPRNVLRTSTLTLLACDLGQTFRGQDQGDFERNPLLGRHPTSLTLVTYFSLAAFAYLLAESTLPPEEASPLSALITGVQMKTVWSNSAQKKGVSLCGLSEARVY